MAQVGAVAQSDAEILVRAEQLGVWLFLDTNHIARRQVNQRRHHISFVGPFVDQRADDRRRQIRRRLAHHHVLRQRLGLGVAAARQKRDEDKQTTAYGDKAGQNQARQVDDSGNISLPFALQFLLLGSGLPARRRRRHQAMRELDTHLVLGVRRNITEVVLDRLAAAYLTSRRVAAIQRALGSNIASIDCLG